jgi:exosortase
MENQTSAHVEADCPEPASYAQGSLWLLMPVFLPWTWMAFKASNLWLTVPGFAFGWLVPVLCLVLLGEIWPKRPLLIGSWRPGNITVCGLGLTCFLLFQSHVAASGSRPAAMFALALSVLLFASGYLHYLYGPKRWWCVWFPFAFVALALPLPSFLYDHLTGWLRLQVGYLAVELLSVTGIPAQLGGYLIYLPKGPVGVEEACSGLRSLQSAFMLAVFFGWIYFKSAMARVVLILWGCVLALMGNVLRVYGLSRMAHDHGFDVVERYHDLTGWIILAMTLGGVVLAVWVSQRVQRFLHINLQHE